MRGTRNTNDSTPTTTSDRAANRRQATDRRQNTAPWTGPERRSGGDRRLQAAARVEIAELEARLLFCVDHLSQAIDHDGNIIGNSGSVDVPMGPSILGSTPDGAVFTNPLSSIPALNSNPGAPATLYLDFDGAAAQAWGGYNVPATPAFSQDGDTSTFTDAELAAIQQIFTRVAEAYAPFNINVTTVDPGTYGDKQALSVVIGGSSGWLGAAAGGVAYVGSFTNYLQNVVWVFPNNLAGGNAKYVADAAEHESGHAFGLQHQSGYSGTRKIAEYRGGTSLVAPIMGSSYGAARSKWTSGQSAIAYNNYQDDMAVIASTTNGFGYRADDHGNTVGTADSLSVSGNALTGSGVIEKTTDVDVFSFVTLTGPVSFTVGGPQFGGLLDATLKIVDLNGTTVASADTASLGETINVNLTAGSYRLIVSSKGTYGDVGQYTITGTVTSDPNFVAPASNLTATRTADGVDLAWYDNAWNETGYVVERSDDGGATWGTLTTLAGDVRGYVDTTVQVGNSYKYRVRAFNDDYTSTDSNVATAAVTPATPGSLTASSISASRIDLSWADVAGETGYVLERCTDRTGWVTIANLAADATGYSDAALAAGTRYYYRLRANSGVGASAVTANVNAFTRPAQSNLTLTVVSTGQVNLSWRDVAGETAYRIERTADGSTWSVIGTRGANVLSWSDTGLTANTVYSYRVIALNTGGDGLAANGTATTLLPAPTGLTVTAASPSQINLAWTNSSGETGYRVERSADGRTWGIVTTLGADVTSYSNTGLAGGTSYIYRVRAINAGGVSTPSSSASTYTVPLAPTLSATVPSDTQISIAWSNVAGETSYLLQRSADGSSGWATLATNAANVVTYANTGLTADTTYYYRVIARNASGDSAASNVIGPRTLLPAPTGLTATAASTSQIDLAWTDSNGESGYRVERTLDGRVWSTLATLGADVTSYSNASLAGGYWYAYRVRAINATGPSLPSAAAQTYTIPVAPTVTAISAASDTQLNLAWSNVAGETNYVIERSADGQNGWTSVASPTVNATTYSNTGLAADTDYFYRVRADNASGDSAWSSVASRRTLLPTVTGLTATGASASQVNLSWDDSSGESGYSIERWNGRLWAPIGTTAAGVTTYSNGALSAGTSYLFRVRAVNAGGASLMSSYATGTTIPLATATTLAAMSTSQIRVSWTNVVGETGYRVERSDDGSTWDVVATPTRDVLAYVDTGRATDTPYFYRVTAFNASGDATPSATKTTRTLLPAPTGLTTISPSASQVNLSWTDSTGETGYVIERTVNNVQWYAIAAVGADVTSYSNTGLSAGYGYGYRVRAVNAGGNSDVSARATGLTRPAAAALSAVSTAPTQINLVWTNVAGESGYRVERSADGTTWSTLTTAAVNVATYVHTGLTTDTVYHYRLTPFNASGDGASTTVSRRTVLAAPTGVAVTATSPSIATVSWADSTGETSYRVERWNGKLWASIASVAANVTSYTNAGLTKGATYYFRVRAINAGGDSPVAASYSVVMPTSTLPVRTAAKAMYAATAFQSRRTIEDLLAA